MRKRWKIIVVLAVIAVVAIVVVEAISGQVSHTFTSSGSIKYP